MKKLSVNEFEKMYGAVGDVVGTIDDVTNLYVSDDEGCAYIGVEYENGDLYVYGARIDRKTTVAELEQLLQ